MSSTVLDFEAFAAHENLRHVALEGIVDVLKEYHHCTAPEPLPVKVLPFMADLTFSDGAAFITMNDQTGLSIEQATASGPGDTVSLRHGGSSGGLQQTCKDCHSAPWIDSRISADALNRAGIDLPGGSSLMFSSLGACSRLSACCCVWRHESGHRRHSSAAYEIWDREPFQFGLRLISLTLDVRSFSATVAHMEAVQLTATAFMSVIAPRLLALHSISDRLTKPMQKLFAHELELLDAAYNRVRHTLVRF